MTARYALYYTPPQGGPLDLFGRAWVGRDCYSGEAVAQHDLPGVDAATLWTATASPRHYGFHATMKPPFRLAEGVSPSDLHAAVAGFAATTPAVATAHLQLDCLGGFLALTPSRGTAALNRLAESCVMAFDRFRAPPGAAELAKRRSSGLSARQDALLTRWGYPYVLDEFRFHLTLTERLPDEARKLIGQVVLPLLHGLLQDDLIVDALSLCTQDDAQAPFRVVERYALTG